MRYNFHLAALCRPQSRPGKTEVGRARIAKVTDKTDHYLADQVAEGDQSTGQGEIVPDVEAPPISQASEDFVFIPIVKSAFDIE